MFKSIVVPIDLAQPSSWRSALPQALKLAEPGRTTVTVMTVVRQLEAMFEGVSFAFQLERLIADAEAKLARVVEGQGATPVQLEREVRIGSIGHEILACAKERAADLIVMESHRPEMLDYLIGPNAAHIVQNATCSVLVLRSSQAA